MFDSPADIEVQELIRTLTEEQQKDMEKFVEFFERQGGMFGCPSLWTIYGQAWLLHNGFELQHSDAKTAEELLGTTAKKLTKLYEHLKG